MYGMEDRKEEAVASVLSPGGNTGFSATLFWDHIVKDLSPFSCETQINLSEWVCLLPLSGQLLFQHCYALRLILDLSRSFEQIKGEWWKNKVVVRWSMLIGNQCWSSETTSREMTEKCSRNNVSSPKSREEVVFFQKIIKRKFSS